MTEPVGVGGLLLAGGQARRMGGGDKCLLEVAGRPMLAHAIERLGPQVDVLAINANGDPGRFAGFGLPVLPDVVPDFAGPLAGVLTGITWLRQAAPHAEWLATAATDTPFFPRDLVARLVARASAERAQVTFAASNGRPHPVFGLWHVSLEVELRAALLHEHERKIDRFADRYRGAEVAFTAGKVDPFFNVNHPEDLVEAGRLSKLVEQAAQA
jgi:molybdopterin-guanine dinucleotide biosynthesis protein A